MCLSVLASACAIGAGPDPSVEQLIGGTAGITLKGSSVRITQTSDTEWTLSKTGSVSGQAVSWTITATKGTTTSGLLIVNGTMKVTNTGTGGATIGNIVLNLQTKSGNSWVTRSSDVADATQDDAATTVKVVSSASSENKSSFTENAASGHLVFTDTATNSIFSLVPQVTVAPGTTKTLLFTATYDNNVLHLANGTSTRIEMIVSFGNASSGASNGTNIDINGNGIVDPDEHHVRSVPSRLGVSVPPQTPANLTPTLSDAASDITTTGTASCTNPQFNLGATSGTVTITCTGGTSGGTVTNCAHLTAPTQSVNSGGFVFPCVLGIDLTACNTQTIGAHTCTPGEPGCGWVAGNEQTFTQDSWGDSTAAGGTLQASYAAVYPSGVVEVGIPGASGFSMQFSGPASAIDYLPATGSPGALTADQINPLSSSSGIFGGDVLALKLNVDFAEAGVTAGTSATHFGDLLLCGFSTLPALNGMTVGGFLAAANTALGGGSALYPISTLDSVANALNLAFVGGTASVFAQDHLFVGSCPI